MGNACGSPNDSRGANQNDGAADEMHLWGDYFSTDTRSIIAALELAKIKHKLDIIETQLGNIREDSTL